MSDDDARVAIGGYANDGNGRYSGHVRIFHVSLAQGRVCRPSQGECDKPEVCDGFSDECPLDEKFGNEKVCRPAEDACDVEEYCSGFSNTCSDDDFKYTGGYTYKCGTSQYLCGVTEGELINKKNPNGKNEKMKPVYYIGSTGEGTCVLGSAAEVVELDPVNCAKALNTVPFQPMPASGTCENARGISNFVSLECVSTLDPEKEELVKEWRWCGKCETVYKSFYDCTTTAYGDPASSEFGDECPDSIGSPARRFLRFLRNLHAIVK
jgi:hypothetical protein